MKAIPTKRWLSLMLSAWCLGGCASHRYLHKVEALPVVVNPGGEDWGIDLALQFSDEIRLTLGNVSSQSVNVLWDECAYIDVDHRSHPMAVASAKKGVSRVSVIAPGSQVDEVLRPVGDGLDRGVDPLLPARGRPLLLSPRFVGDPLFVPANATRELVGKEIGVFLVFERQGARKTVMAKYRIAHVEVT